jgi:PKD repeat protein
VCADATKKVAESSGSNNCREETWSCPKPKTFHGNMTFKELGYETSTFTEEYKSVSIDFESPYEEASGDLNLHLNVLVRREVEIKINGVTILQEKEFAKGEHWEKIDIPTGMIDEGTNMLKISFPRWYYGDGITLLENSTINISGTYLIFSYSPENPIIDEIITFNASSAYDNITKYDWDFGDGANAIGEAVTHYYPSSGAYNVTLVVTLDGDETGTTSKIVEISRWRYDVTVIKESTTIASTTRTMTGLLLMSFTGYESVLGFDACLFTVINTVPGELSDYNITLANTGDYMEKLIDGNYAKLLPINPYEGLRWQDGVSLFSTINIPSSAPTGYAVLGVECVVVPAGNFKCVHVKASYEDNTVGAGGSVFKYVDEWWDEEGRGLIQAKYISTRTWEYKLANFTDLLFPINYMGIENETLVSRYTPNPPTIDGTISAGEWTTHKIPITLNGYNNPQNTITGELYVMHDQNNIYIAVVIPDDNQDADYLLLDFDQGNDHVATNEDAIGFDLNSLYPRFPAGYADLHWEAGWWDVDANAHGYGAHSYEHAHPGVPGEYWYEFTKPLKSGDCQDMALNAGDSIGFRIEVRDGTTGDWYRFPLNTVDADTSQWSEWADLVIGMP